MALIPPVCASQHNFPNISFQSFSFFISSTFYPDISLSMVLFLLFTLTENSDLLNLHSRQQQQIYSSERILEYTGWMHQQVSNLHVSFCALFALLVIRVNLVKHKKWKSEKAKKRQEVKSEE